MFDQNQPEEQLRYVDTKHQTRHRYRKKIGHERALDNKQKKKKRNGKMGNGKKVFDYTYIAIEIQ
jgi:hypothetical protein